MDRKHAPTALAGAGPLGITGRIAVASRRGVVVAVVSALLVVFQGLPGSAPAATGPDCGGSHWVGAWSMSPTDGAPEGFVGQTLRIVVNPHAGGEQLRLRLTNRFGTQPVTFGDAYVGLRATGASVVPGTNQRVSFGGQHAVTVPARGDVVSDPVALTFDAYSDLAVSLHASGSTGPATRHALAVQNNYLTAAGSGSHAAAEGDSAFTGTTSSWFFLEGVDVEARRTVGSVVALGDSITDGLVTTGSPPAEDPTVRGTNGRYPDNLARRLDQLPGPSRLSVLNAGITGNRVLSDGIPPRRGPSAISRLDADVLAQAAVTDVIVMEGTNDIGGAAVPSADAVIAGLDHIVRRLQAAGLNVLLGTIPPAGGFTGGGHGSPEAIAERNRVNEWVRTRPHGAHVVDFHQALRDPANPDRLLPAYDSGDHLHPNLAGYRVMADTVELGHLEGTGCGPIAPGIPTTGPSTTAS